MSARPVWRRSFGDGMTSARKDGALVTVRPAHDGGTRVTVSRPQPFGEDAATGEASYVYVTTHSHRFGGVR